MATPRSAAAVRTTLCAVDADVARGDFLEARDQAQQRRLAAARRTDEHDELAVGDLEVGVADDVDRAEGLVRGPRASGWPWKEFRKVHLMPVEAMPVVM